MIWLASLTNSVTSKGSSRAVLGPLFLHCCLIEAKRPLVATNQSGIENEK